MNRISSHFIATKSTDLFRLKVNGFYPEGDALFRELSERDYGIDGMIELFENGCPSGNIALIQIKGTNDMIVPLKKSDGVSCKVSTSNIQYAFQKNIPVILIYISVKNSIMYYECLNNVSDDISEQKITQKTMTVRIPNRNMVIDDIEPIFSLIRSFYIK